MVFSTKSNGNSPLNNENAGKNYSSLVTVLSDYAPLVKSRAYAFLCSGCELDDLVQEGNIGLITAQLNYNDKLSSFSTFARRCIDSAIIDYLRKMQKLTTIPQDMLVDIDEVQLADFSNNPEYSLSVKDEYNQMTKKANMVLSRLELSVFNGMLHGFSFAEISEKNDIDIKAVRNAVSRIRAKLK